jgi:aryl-alcohol dehydrogenase-like predicted oxidoreductase
MHSMSSRRARRRFLGSLAAAAAAQALPPVGAAENRTPITRAIPATGELLPVIGLGTWITFNVAPDATNEAPLIPVMQELFARGGTMIDSSPMYGYSEAVIGDLLKETPRHRGALFSATKIWTPAKAVGRWQFDQSRRLWGVQRFDLVHVHNLVQWEAHLETLKELKAAGHVRYIGLTTSEGHSTPKWRAHSYASSSTSCSSPTISPTAARKSGCYRSRRNGSLPSSSTDLLTGAISFRLCAVDRCRSTPGSSTAPTGRSFSSNLSSPIRS